jgi:hypothetical protein
MNNQQLIINTLIFNLFLIIYDFRHPLLNNESSVPKVKTLLEDLLQFTNVTPAERCVLKFGKIHAAN